MDEAVFEVRRRACVREVCLSSNHGVRRVFGVFLYSIWAFRAELQSMTDKSACKDGED
jgi:hypothetical protein